MDTVLYDIVKKVGLPVKTAAEVGVLSFQESALRHFCVDGVNCDLYEAVPKFCEEIRKETKDYPNVVLKDFAVSDYNGEMELCMVGASTFDAQLNHTPAIDHDGLDKEQAQRVKVECRDFSEVDEGRYDVVSIDIEGGEWKVLSRMVSRPMVISLETQCRDYINPHIGAITDWMVENKYKVWVWNDTDTIFYKGTPPSLGIKNTVLSKWHNFRFFSGRL